jgi:long-subunit acyl-CoA synthetase (AMP-forming)
MATTIAEVLAATTEAHGQRPAMRYKKDNRWHDITWTQYSEDAHKVAKAFIKLGLAPGSGVSIIGYNCPQWFTADVAAILAGGVPAGIYTTCSAEQCQYITEHCDADIVVAENAEQLAKFKEVRAQLPKVKAYVLMFGEDPDGEALTWDAVLKMGEAESNDGLDERLAAQKPDDVCTLIYTSGTTGPPKAVMITHTNVIWTAETAMQVIRGGHEDILLSYLPLSHIAEQLISVHGPMAMGACTAFAEGLDQLGDNLREVRPTFFLGVPRVWEKIQAKMVTAGAQNSPLKKKIAAWARKIGLEAGYAEQKGDGKPMFFGLANKLVFSKVREKLGLDRCRMAITSAAPISKSTLEFFLSLGLPIYEVYGMSECTGPATISLPRRYRTGSAGFCIPGAELKIAEDGEVCMRGRHVFKGYYKNDEITAETIDAEGWLHSGDIGTIDDAGFLNITDRKKDILITAGGENIAPQLIEGQLKAIPVVAQAVVVGDRRKYLAALFTLDPEKVLAEAQACGSTATDTESASTCETFHAHLLAQVEGINKTLSRVQTIKRFVMIPGEFTIEGGELTPTMKVKRKVIREKYASQIADLYPTS